MTMRRRVKIGRRAPIVEPEIIVVPLIDVMMFLLFFFMVASLAMAVQAGLAVNLPKASTAQQHPAQNLTVTITPTGEIYCNTVKTTIEALGEALKATGASPDNLVIINADQAANYGLVVNAIDESSKVGFTHFTFATQK